MSAPLLCFHIGLPKTGSSAIQSFFNVNRVALARRHRVLYPNLEGEPLDAGDCLNHSALVERSPIEPAAEEICRALEHARRIGCTQVVISSESARLRFVSIVEAVRQRTSAPLRIICYLRRQDHMVEAYWKQWGIKSAAPDIEAFAASTLRRLELGTVKEFDFSSYLARWTKPFGAAALTVRPYEKGQLLGRDVVTDFLSLIGIEDREGFAAPDDTCRNINKGFQPETMALLQLGRRSLGPLHNNLMFGLFYEAFGESGRKLPFESYRLLSPALRLRILEAFEPGNRQVAQELCGRADGKLFFEPAPRVDEPWQPFQLQPERAAAMLLQLLSSQRRKAAALGARVEKVAGRVRSQADFSRVGRGGTGIGAAPPRNRAPVTGETGGAI